MFENYLDMLIPSADAAFMVKTILRFYTILHTVSPGYLWLAKLTVRFGGSMPKWIGQE